MKEIGDLDQAIAYCRSHSNCDGVYTKECRGYVWYALDSPYKWSIDSPGTCAWLRMVSNDDDGVFQ